MYVPVCIYWADRSEEEELCPCLVVRVSISVSGEVQIMIGSPMAVACQNFRSTQQGTNTVCEASGNASATFLP